MRTGRNSPCPCGSGAKYKKCCGRLAETAGSSAKMDSLSRPSRSAPFSHIRIAGDILIKAPNSLHLITSYVLREQEKWFEEEVGFVNRILRPGARVLDVGANYGVYTLLMAKAVGEHGHVWAVEPATSTVNSLRDSISLNNFRNVTVIHAALSNRTGKANLHIDGNSELNKLISEPDATTEEVTLTTLDRCKSELGLANIQFIKLDAEGEELNILLGGGGLLADESPLIMFELRHGDQINAGLISQFAEMGYSTYRLVPGLNLLVPFDAAENPDRYLLNLFCCKEDRALALEKDGWLIGQGHETDAPGIVNPGDWRDTYYLLPFAKGMRRYWEATDRHESGHDGGNCQKAMGLYFLAHAPSRTPRDRHHALLAAFNTIRDVADAGNTSAHLSTYARIAAEMGYRTIAVQTLARLWEKFSKEGRAAPDEPFLPACSRFDHLDPGERPGDWFLASLLEAYETLNAYSSYYTGQMTLGNLETIRNLGYQSPEMERRRQLIRMRFNMQTGPEPSPILSVMSASNLNPGFWISAQ